MELQIKLIWHREFPTRNIATTIARPFNGCCATVTGGMMLPPAEALPSVDGG